MTTSSSCQAPINLKRHHHNSVADGWAPRPLHRAIATPYGRPAGALARAEALLVRRRVGLGAPQRGRRGRRARAARARRDDARARGGRARAAADDARAAARRAVRGARRGSRVRAALPAGRQARGAGGVERRRRRGVERSRAGSNGRTGCAGCLHLEVPFIATHRRDYWEPAGLAPSDLWRIEELDEARAQTQSWRGRGGMAVVW